MKFFKKLRKVIELLIGIFLALIFLYIIFSKEINNEIKIYEKKGFWSYLLDNFVFYSSEFYHWVVYELQNDYVIQGLIAIAIIANIALIFYKRKYVFGFRVIKSFAVLVAVLVVYGGVFAILYFVLPIKYIIIILSLFVIIVILVALKINKNTDLNDRNDFLVEHVTNEDGSEKTHLELTKPYAIFIALKAIFFPTKSVFIGGKGDFKGGGANGKW